MNDIMMTDRQRRDAARIAERRTAALWYAWGREDAGDLTLRDITSERVMALAFGDFAARECEQYVSEQTSFLSNVGDQYGRFLAAHTPGSRFVSEATGDTFRVDDYNPASNETFTTVVDGPHGVPSSVPVGGRVTFSPHVLAGYRLVTS